MRVIRAGRPRHLVEHGLAGRCCTAGDEDGANTHPERDHGQGYKHPSLACGNVGERLVLFDRNFTEEDALVGPQQIACRENDAGGGPGGPVPVNLVCAKQNQKFADETIEHGQTKRRERDKEEERGETRHRRGQAAELRHLKGVAPVVKHADEQEEPAGGDTVSEHLEDRALHGNNMEGEDAENDEAQVADARISDEFFEVWLDKSDQRAVNNADDRKDGDCGCEPARSIGEERQAEADHAVGAHFQQHAGEHDGAGGGSFDVCVGQPGVERKERNFDGEGHEKGEEQKRFRAARKSQRAGLERILNRW